MKGSNRTKPADFNQSFPDIFLPLLNRPNNGGTEGGPVIDPEMMASASKTLPCPLKQSPASPLGQEVN
jgi:hypothetical protein